MLLDYNAQLIMKCVQYLETCWLTGEFYSILYKLQFCTLIFAVLLATFTQWLLVNFNYIISS